ncbi:nucleotide sugar dehydrogenase [Methylobacterium oryzihabitans]|uniref:UDP-glucose 6-dehydrogenase n=1 Tax=Methylobacterium oryzihabitans TaxID=2499852 RepID=A0A437P2R8_9HYPH|nr:nucleotide sugar dehydrogenase [Methylobacterium oryzihabitans]RVU16581.1 nucleotide sugar dehydrogenase [Methylobacterium oryzihabitans]
MKIAVYGLGYVGLTAAGCLTKEGHSVLGVDVSEQKVRETNEGRSPIEEPGLGDLLLDAVQKGLLRCTTDPRSELNSCDIAIVCVGTPSGPDGSHNMTFIAEVSRQIASAVDRNRAVPLTVVYRSTIRPGTIDNLIAPIFKASLGDDLGAVELVYNPEFLREATAISDYFHPPKIVIGTADGQPNARMEEMYKDLDAPVFYTQYGEAEFTKFVDNTFHAVKVAFANEIGRVCVQLGISAAKVHEIFVSDTKLNISPYYLRPGGAFGGSCLPKDVRALQHISSDVGGQTHLIDSLIRSNDSHKHFLFEYVKRDLEPGASVLMLGIAFKSGSDDLRESPKVDLARKLLQAGYKLSIYDPFITVNKLVGQNLGYSFSQLPQLQRILVTSEAAESGRYDLVIDTDNLIKKLNLSSTNVVNVSRLA